MIAEFIRELSYHEFVLVIRHISLPPDAYKRFLVFVVLPYMSNQPVMTRLQTVEENLFVERFLPYHANSTCPVKNAQMSFVLERLLIHFLREGKLSYDEEVLMKLHKGIMARNKHVAGDSRKRKSSTFLDDARDELKLSGERMILYFKMISGT
jgi:hypothetical protein